MASGFIWRVGHFKRDVSCFIWFVSRFPRRVTRFQEPAGDISEAAGFHNREACNRRVRVAPEGWTVVSFKTVAVPFRRLTVRFRRANDAFREAECGFGMRLPARHSRAGMLGRPDVSRMYTKSCIGARGCGYLMAGPSAGK